MDSTAPLATQVTLWLCQDICVQLGINVRQYPLGWARVQETAVMVTHRLFGLHEDRVPIMLPFLAEQRPAAPGETPVPLHYAGELTQRIFLAWRQHCQQAVTCVHAACRHLREEVSQYTRTISGPTPRQESWIRILDAVLDEVEHVMDITVETA